MVETQVWFYTFFSVTLIMFKVSDICKCFYFCRGREIDTIMLLNNYVKFLILYLSLFISFFPGFICSGTVGVA